MQWGRRIVGISALALVIAAGVFAFARMQAVPEGQQSSAAEISETEIPFAPPQIDGVTFSGSRLTLRGSARSGSSVQLYSGDRELETISVLAGPEQISAWSANLAMAGLLPSDGSQIITFSLTTPEGLVLRSSEQLVILTESREQADAIAPVRHAVIIVSPGEASRVLVSPFEGTPKDGALSVRSVDFDDLGGVIVSGLLTEPGVIRVYSNNLAIAETGRFEDGSWVIIAGNVIPAGASELRIVHRLQGSGTEVSEIILPFFRPARGASHSGFSKTENAWHYDVELVGGGRQHGVIYAPLPVEDTSLAGDQ